MKQTVPSRGAGAPARRTSLVVSVPAAEPLVAGFRARFDALSVALRIVPHVTLLFPFAPVSAVDSALLASVAAHFAGRRSFHASLTSVERFPGHVWLAPSPRNRFLELTRATYERFPEYPPYEGAFPEPEPHLTIGAVTAGTSLQTIVEAAGRELAPALPLRFAVTAATLLEEQEDGTWRSTTTFPLADG
jgi:2'-5' RNA ligase